MHETLVRDIRTGQKRQDLDQINEEGVRTWTGPNQLLSHPLLTIYNFILPYPTMFPCLFLYHVSRTFPYFTELSVSLHIITFILNQLPVSSCWFPSGSKKGHFPTCLLQTFFARLGSAPALVSCRALSLSFQAPSSLVQPVLISLNDFSRAVYLSPLTTEALRTSEMSVCFNEDSPCNIPKD